MRRQRSYFRMTYQWSDYGDSTIGAVPTLAITPDGTRVDLEEGPQISRLNRGGSNPWVALEGNVSVKECFWGDDPGRRSGSGGSSIEILAPTGTLFLFQAHCAHCGDPVRLIQENELVSGAVPETYHPDCLAEQEEMRRQAFQEEMRRQAFLEAEMRRQAGD